MQTIIISGAEYHWTETDRGLCLQKAIQVGATKMKDGKTYVFNENKRWTLKREEGAKPKTPRAAKPANAKPANSKKAFGPKAPTQKLLKLREQTALMGQKVGADRLAELKQQATGEENLHALLKQETGGVRKLKPKAEAKPKAPKQLKPKAESSPMGPEIKNLMGAMENTDAKLNALKSQVKPKKQLKPKTEVTPAVKPKVTPKPAAIPPKPPSSPKVKPRKASQRRSLQPKQAPATVANPTTPVPTSAIAQIESHPEIQTAAKRVGAIARAVESVRSMGENNPAIAKLKAQAQANPGAVEDIAVAAIAMAGQFALMPQADLATAALMQGAIGVATRAGARAGKRVREEMKADPNTLKSLQGMLKLGKGVLSDLMSQESQEKMIGDAIGPSLAAGTGAAVGGGLAGAIAGTGAAVGGAPRAAAAIRQVAASKLRPKTAPKKQLRPKAA
jgi:hypothetical protein